MGLTDYIKRKLSKQSQGKGCEFRSLEDCVLKMFKAKGVEPTHDGGMFCVNIQGDSCRFKVGLSCTEKNRLLVYVQFPIPITENVVLAAAYEVRLPKDLAGVRLDMEFEQENKSFIIFAYALADFKSLSQETPNEIFAMVMRTVAALDGENFCRLAAAVFGYKSYEAVKESMHAESAEGQRVTLTLKDGYHELLAETPDIGCSRYLGRLITYALYIVNEKGTDKMKSKMESMLKEQAKYDDIIQTAYNIANDDERDLIRKLRFLGKTKDQDEASDERDSSRGKIEALDIIISQKPWNLLYVGDK